LFCALEKCCKAFSFSSTIDIKLPLRRHEELIVS